MNILSARSIRIGTTVIAGMATAISLTLATRAIAQTEVSLQPPVAQVNR